MEEDPSEAEPDDVFVGTNETTQTSLPRHTWSGQGQQPYTALPGLHLSNGHVPETP